MSSRQSCGAASTWTRAKVTGRRMAAERRRIQSTSALGPETSSPAAPTGASSKMPVPSSPSAAPIPKSSSSAAKVPGTGSPSMARWAMVREVEKPSAPAATASLTSCFMPAMSAGVAGSLRAPRSPMT